MYDFYWSALSYGTFIIYIGKNDHVVTFCFYWWMRSDDFELLILLVNVMTNKFQIVVRFPHDVTNDQLRDTSNF